MANKGIPYEAERITGARAGAHNAIRTDPNSSVIPLARIGWSSAAILVFGYVVLDWASYIHSLHGLNITPWAPAPALALVFLLRFGSKIVPLLGATILISDASVRQLSAPLPIIVLVSFVITFGLWAMGAAIRWRLHGNAIFATRRGLIEWAGIVAIGSAVNGAAFIGTLSLAGAIPAAEWQEAFIRYWIGDCVGILVSMPVLWMAFDERGRAQLKAVARSWEVIGYLATTIVALAVAFGIGAEADFKYFYVLFLPIVWAAARQGLAGAVSVAAAVQIGIIGAVEFLGFPAVTVFEIQALAVVLALFGFFIGLVVDERERVGAELRQTLRLASAGEMAGALAHELNQPLTALAAYGAVSEQLLLKGDTGERLHDAIRHMMVESRRAADVVRRLRDFFRTGSTRLERTGVAVLLQAAASPFAERAARERISLKIDAATDETMLVDRLQIEIVLRNLLANAFDALSEVAEGMPREIVATARSDGGGRVAITIEDSGPGISETNAANLFEPFHSSKSSGLGLGLAISRAIVEAHGGSLWAEVGARGVFSMILPAAGRNESEHKN